MELTEEILENQIKEDKDTPIEMNDDEIKSISQEDLTISNTSINEEFYRNKNEVLNNIGMAMNESGLSLDLISLLISCVRPAAGTISMSAHLKKFVPPGSLNSGKINKKLTAEEIKNKNEENKLIGQGWKLSSLETACSNLRNSSIRLIEEILKEKIFWDIIMKNFDNKEIIYKTRDKETNKRVFAVKYGYEDSGSSYKGNGNAILKQVDNKLEFVPINNTISSNKILRIRILKKLPNEDDFIIVGESTINDSFPKDDSIKSQIDRSRFFIFEEELFNQLADEGNSLIPYNVKIETESKLSIEISNVEIIEIEAIEYNEELMNEEFISNEKVENTRANIISSYLRLMLTIKFKKNLQLKQKSIILKPNNSQNLVSKPNPYSSILRPLVGYFKHEFELEKLYNRLKDLIKDENNSDLKFKKHSNLTKSELLKDPLKRISTIPNTKFIINMNNSLRILILLDSFDYVNHIYHLEVFTRDELFNEVEKQVINVKFEELHQVSECIEWVIEEYK